MLPWEEQEVIRPETVLPIQLHALWRGPAKLAPEHSVLLAMLEQAASDLWNLRFRPRRKMQRIYLDAYQWVMSNERSHPFSFVNVCEALKLSPATLRAGMIKRASEDLTQAA